MQVKFKKNIDKLLIISLIKELNLYMEIIPESIYLEIWFSFDKKDVNIY